MNLQILFRKKKKGFGCNIHTMKCVLNIWAVPWGSGEHFRVQCLSGQPEPGFETPTFQSLDDPLRLIFHFLHSLKEKRAWRQTEATRSTWTLVRSSPPYDLILQSSWTQVRLENQKLFWLGSFVAVATDNAPHCPSTSRCIWWVWNASPKFTFYFPS